MMKLFMLPMQEYEIPANEILIQTQYTPHNAKLHLMGFTKCATKQASQHNLQLILIVNQITMFQNWLKNSALACDSVLNTLHMCM